MAMVVDITGKQAEADILLKKVAARMAARKSTTEILQKGSIPMTVYTGTNGKYEGQQAVFFIEPNHHQLVATDNLEVAEDILQRFSGSVW